MAVTAEQIKKLREETSASISDVKKALEESAGDIEKARTAILRKLGGAAAKRGEREAGAGIVEAYVHGGRVGVLVELYAETDFVARTSDFKELAHDLALHIAAMRPVYKTLQDIPPEIFAEEKKRFENEVEKIGKKGDIAANIVEGKINSYFGELCLFTQPFVKSQDKTVADVINEAIGRFGENIKVGKFVRFEV